MFAVDHALFEIARPVIVGGKHRGIAVLRVERVQIGGRGGDVVVRVVGIGPEIERGPPLAPRLGHELHEPHGTLIRGNRFGLTRHRAAAAFCFHHRANPSRRHMKAPGGTRDLGIPTGDERGRAHSLLDLERRWCAGEQCLRRRRDGDGLHAHNGTHDLARMPHRARTAMSEHGEQRRPRRSKCRQRRSRRPAFARLAWARTASGQLAGNGPVPASLIGLWSNGYHM